MSTDFLWSVKDKALPFMVDESQIECVRALRTAGLLDADICTYLHMPGEGFAFVTGITPQGRAELERMRSRRAGGRMAPVRISARQPQCAGAFAC